MQPITLGALYNVIGRMEGSGRAGTRVKWRVEGREGVWKEEREGGREGELRGGGWRGGRECGKEGGREGGWNGGIVNGGRVGVWEEGQQAGTEGEAGKRRSEERM